MHWRDIRIEEEERLSPYAMKSKNSRGRQLPVAPCEVRLDFERDADRILYSEDFRRLRHKTQVFFNAKNDHICTRMEHVLYVNAISRTIGRTLHMNQDLLTAISLGHDIGHAPFGHSGERTLDKLVNAINPDLHFHHENHSLRVADRLAKRIAPDNQNTRPGLNLTYEVRDGIVSHCGENYDEYVLTADRKKDPCKIYTTNHKHVMPYTLEACLVRLVDKIAYAGRDIEDAVRAQLIDYTDVSKEVRNTLGTTNGEIINTLVEDVIKNSYEQDCIRMSDEIGQALKEMILQNNANIYSSPMIQQYENNASNQMEGLFKMIYKYASEIWNEAVASTPSDENEIKPEAFNKQVGAGMNPLAARLITFIVEKQYSKEDGSPEQITVDYIAGMTDAYAIKTFEEIYWI